MSKKFALIVLGTLCFILFGCSQQSAQQNLETNTVKGAAIGGAIGGVLGGITGAQVGNPQAGFLMGAAAGSGVGALVGHSFDQQEEKIKQLERQVSTSRVEEADLSRRALIESGYERASLGGFEAVAPSDRFYHRLTGTQNLKQGLSPSSSELANMAERAGNNLGFRPNLEPVKAPSNQSAIQTQGIITSNISEQLSNAGSDNNKIDLATVNPYQDKLNLEASRSANKEEQGLYPSAKLETEQPQNKGSSNLASEKLKTNVKPEILNSGETGNQNLVQPGSMASTSLLQKKGSDQVDQTQAKSNLTENISTLGLSQECPEGAKELAKAQQAKELSTKLFHTRRAARLCETFMPAKLALAQMYFELNRLDDANFELENILKLDPNNPEAQELKKRVSAQAK